MKPKLTVPISARLAILAAVIGTVGCESKTEKADLEMMIYHVHPGEDIQPALELAAGTPNPDKIIVHAGTYRPSKPGEAMIWFNERHDGIILEAEGEVILSAANRDVADIGKSSYPAIVNHVVYFGDGVSRDTVLRGFKITGANGYLAPRDGTEEIQPDLTVPNLQKDEFFYSDGGGIKIFGRSYPTIEGVEVYDNFVSPCGAAVSIEHRGYGDISGQGSVLLRDCIFRNNRCPETGAAVDLLHGSAAEISNCLFVGNLPNERAPEYFRGKERWKPKHGAGSLTLFPTSRVVLRRCTFTGNRNGIDDSSAGNIYEDSIFWQNNTPGGWAQGDRYELDLASGDGVRGCFINGVIDDINNNIDSDTNVLDCADPRFDAEFVPQNADFESVGYRPG